MVTTADGIQAAVIWMLAMPAVVPSGTTKSTRYTSYMPGQPNLLTAVRPQNRATAAGVDGPFGGLAVDCGQMGENCPITLGLTGPGYVASFVPLSFAAFLAPEKKGLCRRGYC